MKQPGWLVSLVFHAALLLILSLLVMPLRLREQITLKLGSFIADEIELNDITLGPLDSVEPEVRAPESFAASLVPMAEVASLDLGEIPFIGGLQGGRPSNDGHNEPGRNMTPGGIAGRGDRRENALRLGATKGSEEAVDRALAWLAAHQDYDGSWTFDLNAGRCRGACRHSGTGALAKNGATALGLLPFLGAGHTQHGGKYRRTVTSALNYLILRQGSNGSFYEPQGTMYSHGLASLALCETAAMAEKDGYTAHSRRRDRTLREAAQRAIDFIVQSQHRQGGWRYEPGQRGDTSVVGWQAMALQSARLADLRVPDQTLAAITNFLDSVSSDDYGATYGYQDTAPRPGTTAVGLLCRMYLGWDRTHPGIVNGAEHLSQTGPSSNNVYYDYYATQVMHHYQGPLWERWNVTLRDHLVHTQETRGHEAGSWFFEGDFGSAIGGRLYITAMSAMILEVYYRHMPIYTEQAVAMAK